MPEKEEIRKSSELKFKILLCISFLMVKTSDAFLFLTPSKRCYRSVKNSPTENTTLPFVRKRGKGKKKENKREIHPPVPLKY
ncbi:hypothetical protein CEXT_20321 [Caerostris extrusa]|uniref:Uncharacterized protein n=1 Tax=Caerostris extrusa TaxID=172846 RepID=A0AAV4THX7_CAEEX|nr:hypothetical protein CEXT_20321 [Caerostris extrusa]